MTAPSARTVVRRLVGAAGCALGLIAVAPASALEEDKDVWNYFGGGGISYDNNLLRLPNGIQPAQVGVGDRPRGTWIYNGFARVLMDLPVSRQRFRVDVTGNAYRYADYSYLNYSGWNGRAQWLWEAGNRWKGNAWVERTEALTSFADFRDFGSRNLLRVVTALADADYWVHPNWRVVGGASYQQSRNSQAVFGGADVDQYYGELGFRYITTAQNFVRVTARYTHGEYPERTGPTPVSDTSFDQYDLGADFAWRITGASELSGRIAYTYRYLPNLTSRNFDGPTGRVAYSWQATAKTGLNANARREIGAVDDLTATYIVTSGLGISPYWLISPRVRLDAGYEWVERQYAGDALVPGLPQRVDKLNFARLAVLWLPTRRWSVTAGVVYSDRTSNFPTLQFDDVTSYATVQFAW